MVRGRAFVGISLSLLWMVTIVACSTPSTDSNDTDSESRSVVDTPDTIPSPSPTTKSSTVDRQPASTSTSQATATPTPEPATLRIIVGGANLRSGPSTDYEVLTVLPYHEIAYILARNDDTIWYNVRTESGATGWLGMQVVEVVDMGGVEAIAPAKTFPASPVTSTPARVLATSPPAANSGSGSGSTGAGGSGSSGSGSGGSGSSGCCRVCRIGKACGNSCINRNYTCHQPPGCACNGSLPRLDVASAFFELARDFAVDKTICVGGPELSFVDSWP